MPRIRSSEEIFGGTYALLACGTSEGGGGGGADGFPSSSSN